MSLARGCALAAGLTLLALLLAAPAGAGIREERPNLVGVELWGRSLRFTLNYERFVTHRLGIGGGVMGYPSPDGPLVIVPLYVSFVPADVHSLYLSAGGTLLTGGGRYRNYRSTWLANGSLGFQVQASDGMYFRTMLTLQAPIEPGAGESLFLGLGFAIGGSF